MKRRWKLAIAAGGLLVTAGIADRLLPPSLERARQMSTIVVDREGRLLRAFVTKSGTWRLPANVDDVSPLYRRMLLAYEDRRFHLHPGVDPLALMRAVLQWGANGEVVSGGSTLTMQVARLLEPRARSLGAKMAEAARAVQLELRLSKREILRLYLNLAPMGGNLEGVRAASLAWFGKEPRHLTPGQAALLIALPQSPTSIRPDRYPARARAARNKILVLLASRGVITLEQARDGMAEAIPTRRRPMPFLAPHLARELKAEAPDRRVHRTTVDRPLQQAIRGVVRAELARLHPRATVAVLVVDHRTGRIRAWVGSADFFDTRRLGQVDMVRAVRSPGSTLKPFIYGMGFDARLIHPETIVADVPTRFGGYRPENFLRVYHGDVSVRKALQQSLNIPAVAVLEGVGPARFAARLKRAGIRLRFDSGDKGPGLPLALGGAGVTLHELVTAYAGLARGGRVRPLIIRSEGKGSAGHRLLSPEAAWYVARILEAAPPPTDAVARQMADRPHPIAYKTGTSYGFRDAWAIGYDGRHTVGVWVGRPDGTPSPGRYGRKTAAPILFRIFDLIPETRSGRAGRAVPVQPPAAITGPNVRLPANLQRFRTGREIERRRLTAANRTRLRITFPEDGVQVALQPRSDGRIVLPLTAVGGRKPLRWLVNGRPIKGDPTRRVAFWTPDSAGFVRVTVVDADGNTETVEARLK